MKLSRDRNHSTYPYIALHCSLSALALGAAACGSPPLATPDVASTQVGLTAPDGAAGVWQMNDCSKSSTLLADSSGAGADAQRTASVQCVEAIDGLGVLFDEGKDRVEATGSGFPASSQVTVAAWVRPRSVRDGVIVSKRSNNRDVFALTLNRGNVVFSVELAGKRMTITSRAPLSVDQWAHVAGQYNGRFVFLFLNGEQVGQVAASGAIKDATGRIRMGDGYKGALDDVFVSMRPVSSQEIAEMSCIRRPATVAVDPSSSGAVDPDTQVTYAIEISNHNLGGCGSAFFFANLESTPEGFSATFDPSFAEVAPGASATLSLSVTGTTDAEPGVYKIPFQIFGDAEVLSGEVEYILNAPSGCFVRNARELMIRHLSVVEDPLRSVYDRSSQDARSAVWTFGRLMEQMAPRAADAPVMVENLFKTWLTDQTINGFTVPARPQMQQLVLDNWPRRDGRLDLARAPLRLLAIVNRVDIRNLSQGHAGEGRFVFGVLDPNGFSTQFTVILEYRLPATTEAEVLDWAKRWHALRDLPMPSESYNAALQAITNRFAGRNAEAGRPNGSALGQLRTNEIALSSPWELREFVLSPDGRSLQPATVKLTPDTSFINESPLVAAFVNENESAILIEQHTVPEVFQGTPFLGGSSLNDLFAWRSSGISNNEARHKFSLNTCNGCHSSEETGTPFLMINPREPGGTSFLSAFLTGITLPDPVTGEPRSLNDLKRRADDLEFLVCTSTDARRPAATPGVSVSKGIGRVH